MPLLLAFVRAEPQTPFLPWKRSLRFPSTANADNFLSPGLLAGAILQFHAGDTAHPLGGYARAARIVSGLRKFPSIPPGPGYAPAWLLTVLLWLRQVLTEGNDPARTGGKSSDVCPKEDRGLHIRCASTNFSPAACRLGVVPGVEWPPPGRCG